jgi:hypothetical protein
VANGKASQTNKEPIHGGSISAINLKLMIDSSYQPIENKQSNINGYLLDNDNSGEFVSTYQNPKTRHAIIIHRGTKGTTDWLNNSAYALGVYDMTDRFNKGQNVQDNVYKTDSNSDDCDLTGLFCDIGDMVCFMDKNIFLSKSIDVLFKVKFKKYLSYSIKTGDCKNALGVLIYVELNGNVLAVIGKYPTYSIFEVVIPT